MNPEEITCKALHLEESTFTFPHHLRCDFPTKYCIECQKVMCDKCADCSHSHHKDLIEPIQNIIEKKKALVELLLENVLKTTIVNEVVKLAKLNCEEEEIKRKKALATKNVETFAQIHSRFQLFVKENICITNQFDWFKSPTLSYDAIYSDLLTLKESCA